MDRLRLATAPRSLRWDVGPGPQHLGALSEACHTIKLFVVWTLTVVVSSRGVCQHTPRPDWFGGARPGPRGWDVGIPSAFQPPGVSQVKLCQLDLGGKND